MKTPRSLGEMEGYSLHATDGFIGKIKDFGFDDDTWKVKYAVVELGSWLSSREVMIPRDVLEKASPSFKMLPIKITREEVENSPDRDSDMSVDRQREVEQFKYYGASTYFSWAEGFMGTHSLDMAPPPVWGTEKNKDGKEFDRHLRTVHHLRGRAVKASDGQIGHVRDFIIDDEEWEVKSLVIDIGHIWETKAVLIPREWVKSIGTEDDEIELTVTKEHVKKEPLFNLHVFEYEPETDLVPGTK